MKIVFFQPYLAMWRIQFLARFIRETSHNVLVYDGGFGGKNDTKSVSNNKVPFAFKKLLSWSPVVKVGGQEYPFYFSPGLLFNLVKDRPDVIVTEGEINFVNNFSVFLYCLLFRKKYVWWSLGKVRTRKKTLVNIALDPVVDFLLRRANCVMTRTTWAKEYYVNVKAIPSDKVIVAPNSMDEVLARSEVDAMLVKKLKSDSGGPVVLYVGALTLQKRPGDLVEAFARLLKRPGHATCKLWFVGDGAEKHNLISRAKELGIERNVIFFGKVFEGVGNYFSAADVVVVPGLGGLVINHAMIFGKPVVSRLADGTELDLVVPGETGFLLDDYDIDNLAGAIETVLSPDNLGRMSENAKDLVDDFWNIETMISRVNQCIEFRHE